MIATRRLPPARFPSPIADRPTFWALAGSAMVGALAVGRVDGEAFERYLGPIPPPVAVLLAVGAGAVALDVLGRRGWCPVRERMDRREAGTLVGGAIVLAGAAIAFDILVPFDENMNVAWPRSVLFYPTMAFLAEVALRVLPLAVLAATAGFVSNRWANRVDGGPKAALAAIVAVALLEAGLQSGSAVAGPDPLAALFVAPHLFVIGIVELLAFRRGGFAALATFRLTYYLVWHVVWGALRLRLLF